MAVVTSMGRRIARARRGAACATAALAILVAVSTSGAGAASSSTVVGASVPSATWIDAGGCASNVAGKTSFGSVLPGSKSVTTLDCDVEFGSSNDTAALRTWQGDATGTAMTRGTWVARVSGTAVNLEDVQAISPTTAWVSGQSGRMLRTTDSGVNWTVWTNVQTGTASHIYGVAAPSASVAWGVGSGGTIVYTANGGTDWANQSVGGGQLYDVDAIDVDSAWAVGGGGRILRTDDSGTTWTPQVSGTANDLNDIDVVDGSIAWAVGAGGSILRTTDGGANWLVVPAPLNSFRTVAAINATTAWIGDSSADVKYTANAGTLWTTKLDRDGGVTNAQAIDVVGDVVFSVMYSVGYIDRTIDAGATWFDETPTATPPGLLGVSAADATNVFAVGVGGVIYTTPGTPVSDFADDGSADWDTVGSIDLFGACLRDADLGAAGGGGGWVEDTNAGSDCADGDADPWNAIPAASPGAKIAATNVPDAEAGATDPVAHLRFGFRTLDNQPPGRYLAPITFQVVAPAV